MAQGIATSGLAKFCWASTTPSPEFCIPTSIEIVRAVSSRPRSRRPARYPSRNPPTCRQKTAATSRGPDDRRDDQRDGHDGDQWSDREHLRTEQRKPPSEDDAGNNREDDNLYRIQQQPGRRNVDTTARQGLGEERGHQDRKQR